MRAGVLSFQVALVAGRTVQRTDGEPVYRERGMDGWILNLTVSGRGRINSGRGRFAVMPGEMLLFKPGACHDYHADESAGQWIHDWVYFFPRPEWFDLLIWPEVAPGVLRLDLRSSARRAQIGELFEHLIQLSKSTHFRKTQLAMSVLEQLFLWCDIANPLAAHVRLDPRIQRTLDHLQSHAARSIRISELAQVAGMSASRLAHLFRLQLGISPMQWLENQRMERARELLLMSGRPIADVGSASGMPNPVWFSRCFRRHTGVSPRDFRKRGGERVR
jgi:AraC family transcriptional regulator of arabinose operon